MYYFSVNVCIFLSLWFILLSVPIGRKSISLRRSRKYVAAGAIAFGLLGLTPDKAVEGAPFHLFGSKTAFYNCGYQTRLAGDFCDVSDGFPLSSCPCHNINAMATMLHCYRASYEDQMDSFRSVCEKEYSISISKERIQMALDYYDSYSKPSLGGSQGEVIDHPVKLDDSMLQIFKLAYDQFLGNYDRSVYYGGFLISFWFATFLLISVGNWTKLLFPRLIKKLTGPASNWYRQNVSLTANSRRKTSERKFLYFLDFLVPSREETIILLTFTSMCLYFGVKNIHFVEGDPIFDHKSGAILRYTAVRMGILASSMMPLLILFAGRNNFLQWMTQWNYATFIMLHRWVSRIIIVMVLIHTVSYTLCMPGRMWHPPKPYLRWGILGTTAGVSLLIQGLLVLRRRWYEAFLVLHIILAFAFIGGAYLHVEDRYCLWFYYISGAVWAFDRIIRIGRLLSFGFPKASVYLLADDTLKVIAPVPQDWEIVRGGHVFIHFLHSSSFWQSHPFTYTSSPRNPSELVLYIKVKEGITSSIHKYLSKHPNRCSRIRVAVEGAYGESSPARKYDSAVFVAGGNGIPGIYDEVIDLAYHANSSSRHLKLIWIVKDYSSIYWFYEELMALKDTRVQAEIYITRPSNPINERDYNLRFLPPITHDNDERMLLLSNANINSSDRTMDYASLSNETLRNNTLAELSHVSILEGRPKIDSIVKENITESLGSTIFVPCGHPEMVDDLRASVVSVLGNSEGKRVDYFEQLQVWA